jgi:general secretion pathway protein A
MYNDYFGFREKPFSVTPDPRFFYTNSHYQEAYANLVYAIHERQGFVVLTGEIGTGKTTLLRRLMEHLDPKIRVVLFNNKTLSFEELLDFMCEDLGLEVQAQGRLQKIQALNRFLIEQLANGGTVVLLIDEAQYMTRDHLKLIHYLLNFETNKTKLLQIVLVGQQELGTKIIQYKELASRMFPIAMNAMSLEDLKEMIRFRLNVAGYKGELFENADAAYKTLYTYTKGLPRDAIKVCFELFIDLAAQRKKQATAKQIEEIAKGQNLRV